MEKNRGSNYARHRSKMVRRDNIIVFMIVSILSLSLLGDKDLRKVRQLERFVSIVDA